jgi:putative CocE/NonD family hydrolase
MKRFASLAVLFLARVAAAQTPAATRVFDSSEVMIPMRDGIKLHTTIFRAKDAAGDLPFILTRTPYGIAGGSRALRTSYAELADDGYIFVLQDIRGRYTSEGQFVMLRPLRKNRNDPKAIDEATDTYDTIDWLLKNVPHNNGRVGQLGVSYPGWLTVMSMLDPHPALKAVSPQASPASMFLGDDFHHNGAFRLAYGFEYSVMMEGGKERTPFEFDQYDNYSWWLSQGSLANINPKYLHESRPTWNDFVEHPDFDAFWQREALMQYLTKVTVPTLNVAGWWDQEDFYGPVTIYRELEKHDTDHKNYLVVGPWNHGGWSGASGQKLQNVDFGSETSPYYRKNIQAPWFAYWLKGKGELHLAEATTFEAGANQWREYDSWPPKPSVSSPKRLYFQANGKMSYDPPTETSKTAFDAYISDPNHPVPYRPRPILPTYGRGSTWSTWLADDQRFVQDRPDVMSWESPVLTEDVDIAGDISAHLFAATTGSDADWVVKLIDVYPENDAKLPGYQLMVANDVLRGRYRKSFEHPEAIVPNHTDEYTIDLHTQNYRFLKGHKIRVQVQSTWFPLIDRNPQTYVPNIYKAKESDFHVATQKVFRSKDAASYVSIPVVQRPVIP